MQIVINISDEMYHKIKNNYIIIGGRGNGKTITSTLLNALVMGIPLPKGHGRLIDADAFGKELHRYTEAPYQYALKVFNEAPTIIEADKVENMIQIKNMEMPKRCTECKICVDQKTNDYGTYGKCLLQDKRVDCLAWSRDKNCPLIESEVQK